ncbi:MarR family transcriptional regulator [Olivibacter sp. SDN3]|uniref:MarR family winged helix-turn-helix transcriptional regulator n=1 Tax=Olivibacter sp. SDN3 TaxID=2764720 RepID=UPI001650F8DD|nr:MarR family transcriptional regulator [Olivibacter sp. SDN3]QNL49074.1 MarR family transcriptional regulator [Olivibacter sp. SDN3]
MNQVKNNDDLAIFHLDNLSKLLRNKANQYLSAQGIDVRIEQLPVLFSIPEHGLPQQQIADEIGRDKSSVLRTISNLEREDLVRVTTDVADKRKNCVMLTPKGKILANLIKDKIINLEKVLFNNLKSPEHDRFMQLIKSIGNNLQNIHII